MATVQDLSGLGMPPPLADKLGNTPTTQAGTGTTQTAGSVIQTAVTIGTTGASAYAFVLPTTNYLGRPHFFWNTSATSAVVYPPSGGTINGGSTNAGITIVQNTGGQFMQTVIPSATSSTWQFLSGTGAGSTGSFSTLTASGLVTMQAAATVGTTLGVTGVTTPSGGIAGAVPTGATATAVPTSFHTGNQVGGSTTTATNTVFYIAEVFVPVNTTLTGISMYNGATATGNVQHALFSGDGSIQLAHTASTAQSGTSAYQQIAFTAPFAAIGPAKYYVLSSFSSSSSTFFTHTIGNFTTKSLTAQTYGTLPATLTPPTTFTTAVGPIADTY
jgi:hypothetical protein